METGGKQEKEGSDCFKIIGSDNNCSDNCVFDKQDLMKIIVIMVFPMNRI